MAGNGVKPSALAPSVPGEQLPNPVDQTFEPTNAQMAMQGAVAQGGASSQPMPASAPNDLIAQMDSSLSQKQPADLVSQMDASLQQAPAKGDVPWYQIENQTARNITKGALEALPMAGMLAGGTLAAPGGPVTAVAGGAAGAAGGKALENIGEKYLLGENKSRKDIYAGPAVEGASAATAEMGGQALIKGAGILVKSALVNNALERAGEWAGKVGSKTGEVLTGIPKDVIQTYAKSADEIKTMAKASDNNAFEAAEQLRQKWNGQIQSVRTNLNSQISLAVKDSEKQISARPIIDSLDASIAKINKNYYPEDIKQLEDIKTKIINEIDNTGMLNPAQANEAKGFLQSRASSAYEQGAVFPLGDKAAKAAKSAAAEARSVLNKAIPEVEKANNQLAHLHDLEDSMNLSLIKEGKPEAGIIAAGTGGNLRNASNLKNIGEATGADMLGDAQKLAAMKEFGSPKLMNLNGGKAIGKVGIASAIGYLVGNVPGAVIASALTSPAALRAAIDAGKISSEVISKLASQKGGQALLSVAGLRLLPNGEFEKRPIPGTGR